MNEFKHTIRSDQLGHIRNLADELEHPLFSSLQEIAQIDLILDANVVLAELKWLCSKRKNPNARTNLIEILECGTVKAHAPEFMRQEIEKYLPLHAEKYNISLPQLEEQWCRYQKLIRFVYVEDALEAVKNQARDPKDLPYLQLQEKLGAYIYSNDQDIQGMGGATIKASVIMHLREYSRHAAIEYTIKLCGIGSLVVTQKTLETAYIAIKSIAKKTRTLPKWALWLGAFSIVLALAHPRTREVCKTLLLTLCNAAAKIANELLHATAMLSQQHFEAQQNANQMLEQAGEAGLKLEPPQPKDQPPH